MLFIAFVTNPALVFACVRKNPYPLVLRCLKDSGVSAFFTRSFGREHPGQHGPLPPAWGFAEDPRTPISTPLGATINMAGAAVTIAVITHRGRPHARTWPGRARSRPIILSVHGRERLRLRAPRAWPGGSLHAHPARLRRSSASASDAAMQVVAVGLIIGVLQDSCRNGPQLLLRRPLHGRRR